MTVCRPGRAPPIPGETRTTERHIIHWRVQHITWWKGRKDPPPPCDPEFQRHGSVSHCSPKLVLTGVWLGELTSSQEKNTFCCVLFCFVLLLSDIPKTQQQILWPRCWTCCQRNAVQVSDIARLLLLSDAAMWRDFNHGFSINVWNTFTLRRSKIPNSSYGLLAVSVQAKISFCGKLGVCN